MPSYPATIAIPPDFMAKRMCSNANDEITMNDEASGLPLRQTQKQKHDNLRKERERIIRSIIASTEENNNNNNNNNNNKTIRKTQRRQQSLDRHDDQTRRHRRRRQEQNRAELVDSFRQFCRYALAGTAIAMSLLSTNSCRFLSYRHTIPKITSSTTISPTPAMDAKDNIFASHERIRKHSVTNDYEGQPTGSEDATMQAGAGLFSYSMEYGDNKQDACFRYYDDDDDEEGEYRYSSNNTWFLARYCSVLAPIFAFVAFLQLVLDWCCGIRWGTTKESDGYECKPFVINAMLFFTAGVLQFGTVLFLGMAPLPSQLFYPLVLDDKEMLHEQHEVKFSCFSSSSTSPIQCGIDVGAKLSIASALMFLMLACASVYLLLSTKKSFDDNGDDNTAEEHRRMCAGCHCNTSRKICVIPHRIQQYWRRIRTTELLRTWKYERETGEDDTSHNPQLVYTTSDSSYTSTSSNNTEDEIGFLKKIVYVDVVHQGTTKKPPVATTVIGDIEDSGTIRTESIQKQFGNNAFCHCTYIPVEANNKNEELSTKSRSEEEAQGIELVDEQLAIVYGRIPVEPETYSIVEDSCSSPKNDKLRPVKFVRS